MFLHAIDGLFIAIGLTSLISLLYLKRRPPLDDLRTRWQFVCYTVLGLGTLVAWLTQTPDIFYYTMTVTGVVALGIIWWLPALRRQ